MRQSAEASGRPSREGSSADAIHKLGQRLKVAHQSLHTGPTIRREAVLSFPTNNLPSLVAHADWGTTASKRWMTWAVRDGHRFKAEPPEPVGDTKSLLRRLRSRGLGGPVIVGFDFPIGVASNYARKAGVDNFLTWLPHLGKGEWDRFYEVAKRPVEISIHRPFYPFRPGGASHSQLFEALGVNTADDIRRQCELGHADRRPASPLFWTLGAKQVGKAAISGWREVLGPVLCDPELAIAIWPFSGRVGELLEPGRLVVVETYPAEFYHHLGVAWSPGSAGEKSGKGSQIARKANAASLIAWANASGVDLDSSLQDAIHSGFGASASGEDQFDATIGLFGMLNVLLGYRAMDEPRSDEIRNIEGWIFGQRSAERIDAP